MKSRSGRTSWNVAALIACATVGGFAMASTTHAATAARRAGGVTQAAAQTSVIIEIPEVECAGCSLDARKAVKGAGGVVRLNEGQPKNRLVITYEAAPGRPDVYVDALHKAGFPKAQAVVPSRSEAR